MKLKQEIKITTCLGVQIFKKYIWDVLFLKRLVINWLSATPDAAH